MNTHEAEIQQVRDLFTDAISQIEIEERSIHAFASAALLAAAEVYSEPHGGEGWAGVDLQRPAHLPRWVRMGGVVQSLKQGTRAPVGGAFFSLPQFRGFNDG